MALKKVCDQCNKEVGDDPTKPFMSLHGTFCEQIENAGGDVQFRYLTLYNRTHLLFCDPDCLMQWIKARQNTTTYRRRPVQEEPQIVIHT